MPEVLVESYPEKNCTSPSIVSSYYFGTVVKCSIYDEGGIADWLLANTLDSIFRFVQLIQL